MRTSASQLARAASMINTGSIGPAMSLVKVIARPGHIAGVRSGAGHPLGRQLGRHNVTRASHCHRRTRFGQLPLPERPRHDRRRWPGLADADHAANHAPRILREAYGVSARRRRARCASRQSARRSLPDDGLLVVRAKQRTRHCVRVRRDAAARSVVLRGRDSSREPCSATATGISDLTPTSLFSAESASLREDRLRSQRGAAGGDSIC
jgi:hypothetical protein